MSSFISQNLTEIEAVTGCTFACICHTVSCMFSCLQNNWQPFYLRQLLKFDPFDWLIKIYLLTEGQGTHHKMVSLQPMPRFPLCLPPSLNLNHNAYSTFPHIHVKCESIACSTKIDFNFASEWTLHIILYPG